MAEEIKRYEVAVEYDCAVKYEDKRGDYVLYDDHAAEVARLRAVIHEAHKQALIDYGDMRPCLCEHCAAHRAATKGEPE